jgi:hypothetical protein
MQIQVNCGSGLAQAKSKEDLISTEAWSGSSPLSSQVLTQEVKVGGSQSEAGPGQKFKTIPEKSEKAKKG